MCLVVRHFFSKLVSIREHNFIADNLASINPHWSPEKVFEEARRILIAQVKWPRKYR
jgi:peroxidase